MPEKEVQLICDGSPIWVLKVTVGKQQVYRIRFEGSTTPLIITKGVRASSEQFWTSVPEGRQQEAEAIGRILDNHFNSKQYVLL